MMPKHVGDYCCVSNVHSVMLRTNNERQDARNEICKKKKCCRFCNGLDDMLRVTQQLWPWYWCCCRTISVQRFRHTCTDRLVYGNYRTKGIADVSHVCCPYRWPPDLGCYQLMPIMPCGKFPSALG